MCRDSMEVYLVVKRILPAYLLRITIRVFELWDNFPWDTSIQIMDYRVCPAYFLRPLSFVSFSAFPVFDLAFRNDLLLFLSLGSSKLLASESIKDPSSCPSCRWVPPLSSCQSSSLIHHPHCCASCCHRHCHLRHR